MRRTALRTARRSAGERRGKAFREARFGSGKVTTDYRYTGQREEAGVGLYYYNARWYDPALGRFISADTLVLGPDGMSWNRYTYVRDNPLRYVDPSGHMIDPGRYEGYDDNVSTDADLQRYYALLQRASRTGTSESSYSSKKAAKEAFHLLWMFLFHLGSGKEFFGPSSSLTQDVRQDPQMDEFRERWKEAGYPIPFEDHMQIDERRSDGSCVPTIQGMRSFAKENAEKLLADIGLGSTTPEGTIDAVGGTIGSLDTVRVVSNPNGGVTFQVYNAMGRESLVRIPGTYCRFLPLTDVPWNKSRHLGTLEMWFWWDE